MINVYNPERVNISNNTLIDFLRNELTGNLLKVPGIGKKTLRLLASGNEPIVNSYQLFGKFLSLRNLNDTHQSHCNKFLNWLHKKGIYIHSDNIVMVISEKSNIWIPESYKEE